MPNVTDLVEPWPSLDEVRREFDIELASLERRAATPDTKAGLLVGVAGVLVSLGARVAGVVTPQELRDAYVREPPEVTRRVVLDTRITLYTADERQLQDKLRHLSLALVTLLIAVTVNFVGSIVDMS